MDIKPQWMDKMQEEDLNFIKHFVLASGSLKEMAHFYSVTYPTVRNRLNKIIGLITSNESHDQDPYVGLIKQLTLEDKIDYEAAKLLIHNYRLIKEAPQ